MDPYGSDIKWYPMDLTLNGFSTGSYIFFRANPWALMNASQVLLVLSYFDKTGTAGTAGTAGTGPPRPATERQEASEALPKVQ